MKPGICSHLEFFFLPYPPIQPNISTCSMALPDSHFFLSQLSPCGSSCSFLAFTSLSSYCHYEITAVFPHCLETIISKWTYRTGKVLISFAALIPTNTPPLPFTLHSSLYSWDTVPTLWPNFFPFVWHAFSPIILWNDFVMSTYSSNAFSHARPPLLPEAEWRKACLLLFFCFWYTVII